MKSITLPEWKERASNEDYYQQLRQFRSYLHNANQRVDFKKSARGWGYHLENENIITKTNIDKAETMVNRLRKNDYGINCSLPLDFTAQDDARTWYCDDYDPHYEDPSQYIDIKGTALINGWSYDGECFWDSQDVFIQVLVEKIDLVSLFKPVCDEYYIPISTSKGWSSLNQRGKIITRFYRWQQQGKHPILLYCGDHDPPGLRISNTLKKNLRDLTDAQIPDGDGGYITGWRPDYVTINRFGLNREFIDDYDIPWVDNLQTDSRGGGVSDLSNPRHEDHDKQYVQEYLATHGARKVEANALVAHPDAGRRLFRETVKGYLGENPHDSHHKDIDAGKKQIREAMRDAGVDMRTIQEATTNVRGGMI